MPSIPSNAQVEVPESPDVHGDAAPLHEIPRAVQAGVWLAAAAMLAALIGAYATPWIMPGEVRALYLAYPGSVVAGALCVYLGKLALRLRDRFIAGPEGLHLLHATRAPELLPWSEVVRIRQRPALQRLDLCLRDGRAIPLEYQLSHFETLAEAVIRFAPAATRQRDVADGATAPVSSRTSFRSSRWRVLLVAIAPVALVGSVQAFGGVLLAAYGVAAMCAWAWLTGWREISFEHGALLVKKPFRLRRIAASEVGDVQLMLEYQGRGSRMPAVFVRLRDGEILRFAGAREGEIELRAAFATWLARERQ